MTPNDMNTRGNGTPSPSEYLSIFEAIGSLANVYGVAQVPLVVETEETTRSRARYNLSKPAIAALTTIFQESCAPQGPGMGQREIEMYLSKCGVDSATVPTQKILDIMAKYPSTGGNGGSKGNYLSLEGFLAYYKETVQSNESRVCLAGVILVQCFPLLTHFVLSSLYRSGWIYIYLALGPTLRDARVIR